MTVQAAAGARVLYGARRIAEYLGTSTRVAYHLTTETKRIPHFHVGRTVVASEGAVRSWLEEQERAGKVSRRG